MKNINNVLPFLFSDLNDKAEQSEDQTDTGTSEADSKLGNSEPLVKPQDGSSETVDNSGDASGSVEASAS